MTGGYFLVMPPPGRLRATTPGDDPPLQHAYLKATTMIWAGIVACQMGAAFAVRTSRASLLQPPSYIGIDRRSRSRIDSRRLRGPLAGRRPQRACAARRGSRPSAPRARPSAGQRRAALARSHPARPRPPSRRHRTRRRWPKLVGELEVSRPGSVRCRDGAGRRDRLRLGAGGHVVRLDGRVYEAPTARLQRRPPREINRGRDASCPTPPAQIPACALTHWAPPSGFGVEAHGGPGVKDAGFR